jgi:XRE family transcriptional regulator, regulator of sulfur utilization
MQKLRKDVGKRIRDLRKSADLTQEKLGEISGLSYKFIGEVERGQVNISLDSLEKIVKALRIKIRDIFSEEKISIQKKHPKEEGKLSKLSKKEIQQIKKSLQALNRIF